VKRQSLNHQFLILLCALIFSSCSRSNFPADEIKGAGQSVTHTTADNKTSAPPRIIDISDDVAKSTKDGELYFDDESGYRYWRNSDGKYYLDKKYENGASPNKNIAGKKQKKSRRKTASESKEAVYAIQ
jgi:hypothetical protein